jgi:hypothetical protein
VANASIKDYSGDQKYVKTSGAGSVGDPFIPEVTVGSITAGDANIGNVDIASLPNDPLGAIADAAATPGSTGTLSAKLRLATSQLGALQTALEIIDDWDESDRAKVNPIAGQVGVAAGAGAVSALTQRVTLASDDRLPGSPGQRDCGL